MADMWNLKFHGLYRVGSNPTIRIGQVLFCSQLNPLMHGICCYAQMLGSMAGHSHYYEKDTGSIPVASVY